MNPTPFPPTASWASAPADDPVLPADRAGDDALAKLLDAIWSLRVVSDGVDRSVAGLLAAFPQAERELRKAVAAERQTTAPREIKPGIVAVDTSIPARRLEQLLAAMLDKHAGSDGPRHVRLGASTGPLISAGGLAVQDGRPRAPQPGWRHCLHSDFIMSEEAARIELQQRVLSWLHRMPLADGHSLGHLARQHPDLNRALREQAARAKGQEASFEADGSCLVACRLSSQRVASMIDAAFASVHDIEGAGLQGELPAAELEGISIAPPIGADRAARLPAGPRPQWVEETLVKQAAAAGPPDEPDAKLRNQLAIKAARVEAQRQLWMELEQLVLPNGRTVADAIAARPDGRKLVEQIGNAVFVMSSPAVDKQGVATVTMAIRLESVWQILGR